MPVTTSAAVVLSAVRPALVAPAGAERFADNVSPAGIAELMLAVIFAPVWFVVTFHADDASMTVVGGLPAVAVVMVSDRGPDTETTLIAITWMGPFCVSVCADAVGGTPATNASTPRKRTAFIFNSP